jgi:hypothetical protein
MSDTKKDNRLYVTRQVLQEVQMIWGGSEEAVLEKMRRLSGKEVEIMEEAPSGDETYYLVGTPDRVLMRDVEDKCRVCDGPVFHRPDIPANAVPICMNCADGMTNPQ